jgi:hypothetical protein
LVYFIDTL